ncbi:MAG: sensor histidine kinase [Solirubrobacteraceae bacterium]
MFYSLINFFNSNISIFFVIGLFLIIILLLFSNYQLRNKKTKKLNNPYLNENKAYFKYVEDVSHELKTPLFSIQGYIETLLEGGAINDISVRDSYLKSIYNASERLMKVVKYLDTIHDLEKVELKLHYSVFDLYEIINEVFELLDQKAKENNVILKKPSYPSKVIVSADKNRIFQVFSNLIYNAIIYSNNENIVTLDFQETDKEWQINVSDAGIGIAKEDLKYIFNRFYRADKSRNNKIEGSGLGLSIVEKILTFHNKKITVKSVLNEGTSFSFKLDKP